MLGNQRFLLALPLIAAVAAGCGGDNTATGGAGGTAGTTTTTTEGGSGGTTTTTTTTEGGSGGMAPTCMNNEGPVLAVSELIFGEGDSGQWKSVGYDIDGLTSTANSKDVCMPNAGADPSVPYPDGDNGIDNSFGKNLLPLLLSIYPTWPDEVNKGINNGVFTSLLKIECLPDKGDAPVLNTKLFGATSLDMPPLWDGMDKWPVAPELLSDPKDPLSSTVTFPKSSVLADKFDSGKNQIFILTIPLKTMTASTSIKLTLYAAHATMTLAADHQSSTDGIISGVLDTEELVAEVNKVGALLGLCGTDAFNNILQSVRQASDIMNNGTQDPNQVCNGISLGLGFSMKAAQIGDVGPATPVGMTCPP